MLVFAENMEKISEHNYKNSRYTMKENKFADLTKEEFKATYLGFKYMQQEKTEVKTIPI